MIVEVKEGWKVLSKRTKRNMGIYPTKKLAEKRLKQIEIFKHINKRRK